MKIFLDNHTDGMYIEAMTRDELRAWRAANGYSQARLAKALGVASMTVTRWEMEIRAIPPFLHLALKALEGGDAGPGAGRAHKGKRKGD